MPYRLLALVAIFSWFTAVAVAGRAADAVPVPIQGGTVALSPQNTRLQFLCAHAGPKPDPRKGGFRTFSGQAVVDAAAKSLKSVTVEIDTTSLWTEFDMLTNHLKSPDFFEVRRYPTAKFASTKIEPGSGGSTQITGKLTLHGVTKEITFPATIQVSDAGLTLHSEFSIDRSQFGMTFDPSKVENKVQLTVVVGEKS
jgi:polyisoprenoid-binding protein YceI